MLNKRQICIILVILICIICLLTFVKKKKTSPFQYSVIAHNMGSIDDVNSVDTRQGFELAYSRGDRLFDADLRFSKDGELILCHEWSSFKDVFNFTLEDIHYDDIQVGQVEQELLPTKDEFCNYKYNGKYDLLSFSDVLSYMSKWEDIYIVCDAKEDIEETYLKICNMVNFDPFYLDRIIVSLYRFEDVEKVKAIYPFEYISIRQYNNLIHSKEEIVEFCKTNDIKMVNIKSEFCDAETLKLYNDHQIYTYVAVVNDIEQFNEWKRTGEITGIVSDYIYEDMVGGE